MSKQKTNMLSSLLVPVPLLENKSLLILSISPTSYFYKYPKKQKNTFKFSSVWISHCSPCRTPHCSRGTCPKGSCCPLRAHTGAFFSPWGTHTGAVCEGLYPVGGSPCWSRSVRREKVWGKSCRDKVSRNRQAQPVPHSSDARLKLSLGRREWEGKVFLVLSLFLTILLNKLIFPESSLFCLWQ